MSANWASPSPSNYLSYAAGDFAGTGAYSMVLLVDPAGNDCRFSSWFATAAEKGQFLLDAGDLFGKEDFEGATCGYGSGTSWVLVAITKAAGDQVYRMHWWTYASDGSGTMNHADSGVDTHVDETGPTTTCRVGYSSGTSMVGNIAVAGFADRALSDAEIDTLKTANLSDWAALGFDLGVELSAWDGTAGSDVVWAGSSGAATEVGTVGVGGNPSGFDFSLGPPPEQPEGTKNKSAMRAMTGGRF